MLRFICVIAIAGLALGCSSDDSSGGSGGTAGTTGGDCTTMKCTATTQCVYVNGSAQCAALCGDAGACPSGQVCGCGSSCPTCKDCLSVCVNQ